MLIGPKINATKSKPKIPIRPQFKAPKIVNGINTYVVSPLIFFLLLTVMYLGDTQDNAIIIIFECVRNHNKRIGKTFLCP